MNPTIKKLLSNSIQIGIKGVKSTFLPGIFLQVIALGIIIAYYNHQGTANFLNTLGALNAKHAPWSAILSTGLFGGVLPICIEFFLSKKHPELVKSTAKNLYTITYWALSGAMIYYFYQFNGWLFGTDPTFLTVVKKMLFDQFLWVFLVPAPMMVYCYLYRDLDFSFKNLSKALKQKGYWERALPVIITNWSVWIPSCLIVYSLPTDLQLPLVNIILSIWSLILTFVTIQQHD